MILLQHVLNDCAGHHFQDLVQCNFLYYRKLYIRQLPAIQQGSSRLEQYTNGISLANYVMEKLNFSFVKVEGT